MVQIRVDRCDDMEPELVVDAHADVGEGPVWDQENGRLLWVDITRGQLHLYNPETGKDTVFDAGAPLGCVAPRDGGGIILGLAGGLAALDERTGHAERFVPIEADRPDTRLNDGKCDAVGRFWVGSVRGDEATPTGALYRVDVDGSVAPAVTGTRISNGLGWSPDGRTMYFIDTPTLGIDVFRFDPASGTIGERRRLVTIASADGLPDGLTVDREGCLWVAYWGGWCVRRFTPDGTLDRTVRLPVSQVSCVGFGGPDLQDLYITSAACELGTEQLAEQPNAGGLFRFHADVPGLPTHPFRG